MLIAFIDDCVSGPMLTLLLPIHTSIRGHFVFVLFAIAYVLYSLFSSFAVLLSFKMRNKLKGVGQIVEWSIRDESLHSEAGCWLFRTLIQENPKLKTQELEAAINEAALLSLKLELDFIKKIYELGDLEGCSQYDLENFIKNRVNTKLGDLGYKPIVSNIDMTAVERMKWFDHLSAGKQHTDFFANRVTNYSKGHLTWDESIF